MTTAMNLTIYRLILATNAHICSIPSLQGWLVALSRNGGDPAEACRHMVSLPDAEVDQATDRDEGINEGLEGGHPELARAWVVFKLNSAMHTLGVGAIANWLRMVYEGYGITLNLCKSKA